MKKKLILWGLIILIPAAGAWAAPRMVESAVPAAYYVTPMVKVYENIISCSGVIQPGEVYKIYASGGFVAEEVMAAVGDQVEEGQRLLTVNAEQTERLNRNPVSAVIDEAVGSVGTAADALDLAAILSAFGMGGLTGGLDLEGVAGVFQDADPGAGKSVSFLTEHEITEITAPASGIVAEAGIIPGGIATPGKSLFTIHDIKRYKVVAAVNEADVSKIQVGDRASIRGAGFPGTSYDGMVTAIAPVAHKALAGTATETVVEVEIKILNPNNKIRPGFSARVEIIGEHRHELITVPYEAIRQDEHNNEYVYLFENGRLVRSNIVTGRELTNEVEILAGLTADSVVIYNPDDVQGEGSMVKLTARK